MVKVKHDNAVVSLPRETFANLGRVLRRESDARANGQYRTMLTIRGYGDWMAAYRRIDEVFSDWGATYGDSYRVLLDILIDSISYYPPSKMRFVVN